MQAKMITLSGRVYTAGVKTGRPAKHPRTPFGERLHSAREELGLSQAQVAKIIGITQNAYAMWERHPIALRPEQIQKVAQVLNISVESLFKAKATSQRKGGPIGKVRKVFEEVNKLPRSQQQRMLSVVEDMITARKSA